MSEHRAPAREKLATRVVRDIRRDIVERNWPVGELLGGETELLTRYDVSRAVFREAVRLLEYSGVVEMRRGPSGGLYVAEQPSTAVVNVIVSYLDAVDVGIEEIYDALLVLEPLATELAVERITETGIRRLRDALEEEHRREAEHDPLPNLLHFAIADASRSPALALIIQALSIAAAERVPLRSRGGRTDASALHTAHRLIVESIAAGDVSTAIRRTRTHLRGVRQWHVANQMSSPEPLHEAWNRSRTDGRGGTKLPDRLARFIRSEIRQQGFPEGLVIGSEADFLERYSVSRGAFREAVRILEYLGVAEMRRGPNGGLVVRRPVLDRASSEVVDYLRFLDLDHTDVGRIRKEAEIGCLSRAVDRLDDVSRRRLGEALEVEQRATSDTYHVAGGDLHRLLAEISGNRPLHFVAEVSTRLVRFGFDDEAAALSLDDSVDVTRRVHARIVEAVLEGDESLALYRMRRHLDALNDYYTPLLDHLEGDHRR